MAVIDKGMGVGRSFFERSGPVGKLAGWAVDLALITICGVLIARLVWTIVTPSAFVAADPISTTGGNNPPSAARFVAKPTILTEFNPFARDLQPAAQTETTDAPETSLNLAIRSIILSSNSEQSIVRIQTPDNSVNRFSVGDTVVSGVVLDRILGDRVILIRSGQRETLYVSERNVIGAVETQRPTPAPTPAAPVSNAASSVSVASFDELYNRLVIQRIAREGGGTALQVRNGSDAALLNELGFELDDVLLTVNGYDLSDESLGDLYTTLSAATQLNFSVERGGVPLTRTIQIQQGDREN